MLLGVRTHLLKFRHIEPDKIKKSEEIVELCVGGIKYCVTKRHLLQHEESYFAANFKKVWRKVDQTSISIDRDATDIYHETVLVKVRSILPFLKN